MQFVNGCPKMVHKVIALDITGKVIKEVIETYDLDKANKVKDDLLNDLLEEPRTIEGVDVASVEVMSKWDR